MEVDCCRVEGVYVGSEITPTCIPSAVTSSLFKMATRRPEGPENRWQALARAALRDDLFSCERALTADVLTGTAQDADTAQRVDHWLEENSAAVHRCKQVLGDLHSVPHVDFAMLSVAMGEIRALQR